MIIGIIPARYGSTRLPGKMLLEVEGKPVLWHTWSRASKAMSLDRLVIAAGDKVIASAARSWGADVVEAFDECQSGSDRVWQAYRKSEIRNQKSDIIINIQGDEVQIDAGTIDAVVEKLQADPGAGVGTAAGPLETEEDFFGDAIVKVVLDVQGRALYFSRAPIPYGMIQRSEIRDQRSEIRNQKLLRHIGIYAYRHEMLELFTSLPPGPLELAERLEQLRLIEQGVRYSVAVVAKAGIEVNTAGDLEQIRKLGI